MCRRMVSYTWITWVLENEDLLNLIIAFLSFLVTSILTILIIQQTSRLAKKQSEQERLINQQQEDLQKRQIKIETFEYKNSIYHAVYKVFQLTNMITVFFSKINLEEKSMEQLSQMFDTMRSHLQIDVAETLWLFRQAEYILPSNIYESVKDIAGNFDELAGDFCKFKLFQTILTPNEIGVTKKLLYDDIMNRTTQINRHVLFITSIMPRELDISSLEK